MANPLKTDLTFVKRILRYLKDTTISCGLDVQPVRACTSFSDADWASDVDDWKSTSGSAIFGSQSYFMVVSKATNHCSFQH